MTTSPPLSKLAPSHTTPQAYRRTILTITHSFAEICPTTDPDDMLITYSMADAIGNNFTWSDCSATLSDTNCVSDLQFPSLPSNASFSQSSDLPKQTGALTNLPGQLSTPVSGYTVTWTADNTPYTITATSATVTGQSSSASSSGGAKSTASKSGASGSASAGASGSATTTGNAAIRTEMATGALVLGLVAAVAGF